MRYSLRATIGYFNHAGLLMVHVESESFLNRADALKWAIERLTFHSPSPFQYSIDPI